MVEIQNFVAVRRNRVSVSTKKAYLSILNNVKNYFVEKYPNSVTYIDVSEDQRLSELVLPLVPDQIRDFWAIFARYDRYDFNSSDFKSLSTVTMVRSVLKWFYRENAPPKLENFSVDIIVEYQS